MIDTKKLRENLESPTTDKKVVIDNLIVAIDELVLAFNELKDVALETDRLSQVVQQENQLMIQSAIDYSSAIKDIHMILNRNNPEEIEAVKMELAKWILNPAQIKLGVIKNASKSNS